MSPKAAHLLALIIGASAFLLVACAMLAQDEVKTPPSVAPSGVASTSPRRNGLGHVEKISVLVGMDVRSPKNDLLATVNDLALDLANGRIALVILATAGACTPGELFVAMPPCYLRHDVTNGVLELNTDRVNLESVPRFGTEKLGNYCQTNEMAKICRDLGAEPYFAPRYKTNEVYTQGITNRPHIALKNLLDKKTDGIDQIAVALVYFVEEPCVTTNSTIELIPDSAIHVAEFSLAAKLLGVLVRNAESEPIGYVENIMVDFSSGRLAAVIVSSGEYLGMPGEMSAVPPGAFKSGTERGALLLDVSKMALIAAPHFNADRWPDFAKPGYAERIHRAYGIDPYFTAIAPAGTNTAGGE